MWQRIQVMLMKEFLELRRDPWAMFRLVMPLVVQVLIYGYAATFTVNHVSTVVLDLDHSQASRTLISYFTGNGRFDLVDIAATQAQVTRDIDRGNAVAAIIIHAGFAQHLNNGETAPLAVAVDGTNSNTALIALGYISQIVAQYQADMAPSPPVSGAAPGSLAITLQPRPWFNPGLEDRWFFIPGVIGTLTLIQVVSLTAFAIVRERELGTLEQIMVSPITPLEFILGKTVPYFIIGCFDVALITVLGVLWFHIPFVSSPLVLLLGTFLFLIAAIGFGLLLSTVSKTQQQAFALNFFLVFPLFILSGFAFPIAAMPKIMQWCTLVNPLRYFLIVIRAVFLKGVGVGVLWPSLTALALLGAAMLGVSVLRFRKSLD
ncbi:MAG TPA: ABC transporter permease [Acidocella sp.]|jgi:ABC-2 type transport system permease protein|uniref:ABC transporter permease n=1 Tax=Acidocella sp. TaxID=50710 RepID=UPI002BC2D835|nr:ABC transporter permease [Acidocella sp.]HVE21532.1 ABC transporter permease [Acidocella sp.]